MRKTIAAGAAALALFSLAACGGKGKNEAAEANEHVAGDSNTMGEAVSDVDAANAAMDDAFNDAEANYANVTVGNAAEIED